MRKLGKRRPRFRPQPSPRVLGQPLSGTLALVWGPGRERAGQKFLVEHCVERTLRELHFHCGQVFKEHKRLMSALQTSARARLRVPDTKELS